MRANAGSGILSRGSLPTKRGQMKSFVRKLIDIEELPP